MSSIIIILICNYLSLFDFVYELDIWVSSLDTSQINVLYHAQEVQLKLGDSIHGSTLR